MFALNPDSQKANALFPTANRSAEKHEPWFKGKPPLQIVYRILDGGWKENSDQIQFIDFIPSWTNRQTSENACSSLFMKYESEH